MPAAVLSGHAVNSGIVDDVVDDEPLDANVVSPFPGDIDEVECCATFPNVVFLFMRKIFFTVYINRSKLNYL